MVQPKIRGRRAMETIKDQNQILLRGTVAGEAVYSHESHGERFFRFPLSAPRLSGNEDILNIQLPRRLLDECQLKVGEWVEVLGSVRTFNDRAQTTGSRLVITVLASELKPGRKEPANQLDLRGTICRRSDVRRTPLGREICDFTLAVNRRYGRSDYLPCIAWGSVAQRCARMDVGSRVALDGRLQSRAYVKQFPDHSENRVAYEVSAMGVEPEE